MSSEKYTFKQGWDTTIHLAERPKSKTLTTANMRMTGTLIHCYGECKMVQPL